MTLTGEKRTTTVQGITFEVWSDLIKRGTFARPIDGECESWGEKMLSYNGYITKDLSVRKRIADLYGLKSFKK